MTASEMAVPSVTMRAASQGGTRPPCSGRSATPERFTPGIVTCELPSTREAGMLAVELSGLRDRDGAATDRQRAHSISGPANVRSDDVRDAAITAAVRASGDH